MLYEEYNFPITQSVDEKEKKKNKLKKSKTKQKEENSPMDSSPFLDYEDDFTDIKEKKSKDIEKKTKQYVEKNSMKQNENTSNEFDLDNINDNKNKKNLLGHKINRTQEKKSEKSKNKNNQKEKKQINKKKKKFLTQKKSKITTIPIIAIFESDDENKNKIKNISQSKNNEKRTSNISPSENTKDNYFELDFNGINSLSKSNKIINSNKNKISPSILSQPNNSQNQKENLSNNKLLLKYLSEPSNVINNVNEIKLIKDKIEKCNELYFKLVYTSVKDRDDYHTFKYSVINNYRHLILIKTKKEKRFGIYFTEQLFCSKGKLNQEIIDMMGFIFSFDKCKFYEPNERLICFTQSPQIPYLFKLSDFSICIKNNFLSCKHHLGQTNRVFNIKNLYDELNGGEKEYNISVLEVYRVEIPNK